MDKEKKNRSGSQSNDGSKQNTSFSGGKSDMKGAPLKSNRQTGDHEKDDSSRGADKNTTKKQANSI
jgi:hypothetical protein